MKIQIAISALFTAAAFLTPAYATTVTFTSTLPAAGNYTSGSTAGELSLGSAGDILTYGYDGMFTGTPVGTSLAPNSGATELDTTVKNGLNGVAGVGDDNTTPGNQDDGYIAPTDAVVLDFANVNSTVTSGGSTLTENQVTFNVYEDYAGADYEVYALTSAASTLNTSNATWALVSSGVITAGGTLHISTPISSSSDPTYYAIGVTDCAIDIESVAVQYAGTGTSSVPEPGTFVMAGTALIGLGVAMKKRTRKA